MCDFPFIMGFLGKDGREGVITKQTVDVVGAPAGEPAKTANDGSYKFAGEPGIEGVAVYRDRTGPSGGIPVLFLYAVLTFPAAEPTVCATE